ncbi:MFS transporter [Magnetospira sp. QH-2]|uniref:AmpG family muropeptide MFS transporter n=1 Tax=Magnetospira sp. (strain QH-2) TaxID=1288970 RepID=UPI0003E81B7F|nr:MFS transporter [Magnetospira sp. QH-2]CCQ72221.1 Putative Muropeptide permease (major facilitator family) [Magnetospira sp. QH-2]
MHGWIDSLAVYRDKRVLRLLFLGFSAGIPILLVFSTLSVWLREAGVERAAVGFFSWAALGYGFKFIWAPLVDHLPLPLLTRQLGRRRSWLLVSQVMIIAALVLQAFNDPVTNLTLAAVFAVMLGFSSATQDIVIDAYRIEAADVDLQASLSAAYIAGYRIGMILAGAVALEIAGGLDPDPDSYQHSPWFWTYLCMAAAMGIGLITTLTVPEPDPVAGRRELDRPFAHYLRFIALFALSVAGFVVMFLLTADTAAQAKQALGGGTLSGFLVETGRLVLALIVALITGRGLVAAGLTPKDMVREAYVDPFADFFTRFGKLALLVLTLIAFYRISDVVMGVMANVFYVDIGFDKQTIGRVTKGFGLIMTILGGFAGGLLAYRFGVLKALFIGGLLVAATNALFALLAVSGAQLTLLMAVIAADNLSGGIASAAFVAYLSGLTSSGHTATQYALFSSIMLLLPKVIAGYSGMMVDAVGYVWFFLGTAALGLPVLVLIGAVGLWVRERN